MAYVFTPVYTGKLSQRVIPKTIYDPTAVCGQFGADIVTHVPIVRQNGNQECGYYHTQVLGVAYLDRQLLNRQDTPPAELRVKCQRK